MQISEIFTLLNEISPFELQAKWDNSGLNIGDMHSYFKQLYIALELDWQVLESMQPQSLLLVHHPIIFKPIQNFHTNIYPNNLIAACIKKDISVISLHTNFDITHLNNAFAERLELEKLSFSYSYTQDFSLIYTQNIADSITLKDLALHIKKTLQLHTLRYSEGYNEIKNLYITCGSNAESYKIAQKGDCILTGDIKYHDAMIANSNGISFIEIPHFESECIFANLVLKTLQKTNIQAIILNSHNPFCFI